MAWSICLGNSLPIHMMGKLCINFGPPLRAQTHCFEIIINNIVDRGLILSYIYAYILSFLSLDVFPYSCVTFSEECLVLC